MAIRSAIGTSCFSAASLNSAKRDEVGGGSFWTKAPTESKDPNKATPASPAALILRKARRSITPGSASGLGSGGRSVYLEDISPPFGAIHPAPFVHFASIITNTGAMLQAYGVYRNCPVSSPQEGGAVRTPAGF